MRVNQAHIRQLERYYLGVNVHDSNIRVIAIADAAEYCLHNLEYDNDTLTNAITEYEEKTHAFNICLSQIASHLGRLTGIAEEYREVGHPDRNVRELVLDRIMTNFRTVQELKADLDEKNKDRFREACWEYIKRFLFVGIVGSSSLLLPPVLSLVYSCIFNSACFKDITSFYDFLAKINEFMGKTGWGIIGGFIAVSAIIWYAREFYWLPGCIEEATQKIQGILNTQIRPEGGGNVNFDEFKTERAKTLFFLETFQKAKSLLNHPAPVVAMHP